MLLFGLVSIHETASSGFASFLLAITQDKEAWQNLFRTDERRRRWNVPRQARDHSTRCFLEIHGEVISARGHEQASGACGGGSLDKLGAIRRTVFLEVHDEVVSARGHEQAGGASNGSRGRIRTYDPPQAD